MAIRIASLFVGLTADDRDYRSKLDRSKARTREWERAVTDATGRARAAFTTLGVGAGVATAALTAAYASSAVEIDNLAKSAAKLGDTTENLTAFGFAAEMSGVGADQATTALQRMTRRIAEAAQGSGEAVKAINELGLDAQRLARLKPSEAFEAIQEAMEGIVNQNDKVRLTFKFFDSEGVGLVNTTRDVLQKARDDVEALGGAINGLQAKAVEDANDAVARLGLAYDLTSQRITANFAPALEVIADGFFESAKQSQQFEETIDALIRSTLGGMSTLAGQLSNILGFVEQRPEVAEFGTLGYLLFGKKGAAIGAGLGFFTDEVKDTFDKVKAQFTDIDTAGIDALNDRLDTLRKRQELIANTRDFSGDFAAGAFESVLGEADEIQTEIDQIEGKLASFDSFTVNTTSVIGGLSNALGQVADTLALASNATVRLGDEVGNIDTPLIPPIAPNIPGLSGIPSPSIEAPTVDPIFIDVNYGGAYNYDEQFESARVAREVINESLQQSADISQMFEEERLESARRANQEDLRQSRLYFDEKRAQVMAFQDQWTVFQQAGAADRFNILSGELGSSLAALGEYNKGFFLLNQAAGTANAVINTAQGITEALKLPFPANLAAAAVVAAEGAAQIVAISQASLGQSQSPTVGGATVNTDVSSAGGSTREIESGEDVDAQPSVQNNIFIINADELIDEDKFRERSVKAVADASSSRSLIVDRELRLVANNESA